MSRLLPVAVLLALCVAGVLFWLARGGGDPAGPPAPPGVRPPGAVERGVIERGADAPVLDGGRREVAEGAPRSDGPTGPDEGEAREAATLRVVGVPVARTVDPSVFAGALVELRPQDDAAERRRVRVSRLDDRLEVLFERVDPAVVWVVHVVPASGVVSSRPDVRLAPGEDARVEVDLLSGGTVFGKVLGQDGQPLGRAQLTVRSDSPTDERPWARSSTTEADGTFEVSGIREGRVTLEVEHAAVERVEDVGALAEAQTIGPLEVRLEDGAVVSGTVRWSDGSPAAGARVFASQRVGDQRPRGAQAVAGEDGAFRLLGLALGPCEVLASPGASDQEPPDRLAYRAWAATRAPATVDLELQPSPTVSGRVVDDQGAPVAAFRVVAVAVDAPGTHPWNDTQEAADSPDGTFVVRPPRPGPTRISAFDRGGSSYGQVVLDVRGEVAGVELVLPRPASVSGVLRDAGGAPLARAWVYVLPEGDVGVGTRAPRRSITDAEGRFRVDRVAPGRVRVSSKRAPEEDAVQLELHPGEERTGVELRG